MLRQKETVTLPAVSKTTQLGVQMTTTDPRINFTVKQNVKRLSMWYKTWHIWQKRVFICRVMEHCSKQHLEFLATALEPILHLDFSSSLVPHMAALHLDGVATFQVQRSIMQSVVRTETEDGSLAYLNSIPTTLLTDSTDDGKIDPSASQITTQGSDVAMVTREPKPKKEILLPVLPLTHVEHAGPLSSQHPSIEASIILHRKRFSSVPDFKSTTDLLRNVRHKELKKRRHKRSQSLGVYSTGAPNGDRSAEHFKSQLALLSDVSCLSLVSVKDLNHATFCLLVDGTMAGPSVRLSSLGDGETLRQGPTGVPSSMPVSKVQGFSSHVARC